MSILEAVLLLLIVLWALGYWGPYAHHLGPFVHLLLIVALVLLVVAVVRRVAP